MHGTSLSALRDRIGFLSPQAIRAPAFSVISTLQDQDPAAQVMGIGVAFCALVEEMGLDMEDAIYVCERTLADSEGPYTEHIQAIRAYARGELLGKVTR